MEVDEGVLQHPTPTPTLTLTRCVHVDVDESVLQHHSTTKLTTCGRRQLARLRRGLCEGEARHVKWLVAEQARARELLVAERFRLVHLRLPEVKG